MRYLSRYLAVSMLLPLVACGAPKSSTKTTNGKSNTVQAASDSSNAAATKRDLAISWDARTGAAAESFNVYGQASPTAAEVPLMQMQAATTGFNPAKPSALLHLTDAAFAPFLGKTICLSVTAVVAGIESKPSNLSCVPL